MAAFTAMFLALFMGALLFGMINITYAYNAYGILDNAAFVGAEDGANSVDLRAWYGGELALADPEGQCQRSVAAQLLGSRSLFAADPEIRCVVSRSAVNGADTTVTATISAPVRVFAVGSGWGPTILMTTTQRASAAYGVDVPVQPSP